MEGKLRMRGGKERGLGIEGRKMEGEGFEIKWRDIGTKLEEINGRGEARKKDELIGKTE